MCVCAPHQTVKAELEVKRPTMDKLCSMSQDLLSSVKNKEVASKLEARLDSFAQRWDRLIQGLELSSSQVPHAHRLRFYHGVAFILRLLQRVVRW